MKQLAVFAAGLWALGISQPASAQTFQNNDTVLESRTVSPILTGSPSPVDPMSVTCGQFNDDDGDGVITDEDFVDCVSLTRNNYPISSPEPEPGICTLINTGVQNNAPNQFNDGYAQTTGDPISGFDSLMGSIRSGALDGIGPEDLVALLAAPRNSAPLTLRTIANADFTTSTGVDCTVVPAPLGTSTEVGWQVNPDAEQSTLQGDGERGMELFDCDGDGDLDSVVAVANPTIFPPEYFINVNLNAGSGLQPGPNQFDTTISIGTDGDEPSVLDTADFNGDGIPDVAFASNGDDTDSLAICYGDGTADDCSFTCGIQVDLEALTSFNADPTSIEAADFDGDGDTDVAIVLSAFGTRSLAYFFNNGSTGATGPNFAAVDSQLIGTQPSTTGQPYAVTSGFFNNDDVPDAAVTNRVDPFNGEISTVIVILSDGSGGLLPPETLNFPPNPVNTPFFGEADAIAAADFDHCGGDDIVALAQSPNSVPGVPGVPIKFGSIVPQLFKQAHFWYNVDEPPVATAVTPLSGDVDTPIAVTATCSDPTDDDRTFAWTIAGPSGSTSSIAPPNGALSGTAVDIAGLFQGDTPGDYTLTLTCNSCDLSATATVVVTLNQNAVPFTQGGCLANLAPAKAVSASVRWMGGLLLAVPALLFSWRRRNRA